MNSVWQKVKDTLKQKLPAHCYRMWIEPIHCSRAEDGTYILGCPNPFSKNRVKLHYSDFISAALTEIAGEGQPFDIVVHGGNGQGPSEIEKSLQLPLPNINLRPQSGRVLRRDFTFEQFVVGCNNDLAYTASIALASQRRNGQNSLFLLSKTGMGKSHLTHAVGNRVLAENPRRKVYYITAEDFSNEMICAYRHDTIDRFKSKYRNQCDVLLLEDIHYLSGKTRTQVELAALFDTLQACGKKILFSSCHPPADIPNLKDELRSRLGCGLVSEIGPPDYSMRVRILQKKIKAQGFRIPADVLHYLASELTEDVRQLESGLIGVATSADLLGTKIDLNLAESVVKKIAKNKKQITIDVIKKLVCKHFNITVKDITSRSRRQNVVRPRQIAMYLARHYTDAPLETIGKSFNRLHGTALHSIHIVEKAMEKNGAMQQQVEYMVRRLESGRF
jgi:chromosomal replication initiator protein